MKKNRLGIKIACIVVAVVFVIFAVFMGVRWQRTQSVQKQLDAFSLQVDDYKDELRKFYLGEYEDEYEELKENAREVIDTKDISKIPGILKNYKQLCKDVKKADEEMLEKELAEAQEKLEEAKKNSYVSDETLSEIEQATQSINSYKDSGDYKAAYEAANKLIEKASTAAVVYDNLQIQLTQVDASEYPTIRLYIDVRDKASQEVPKGLSKGFFFLSEKEAKSSEYVKKEIEKVVQLDEEESLNINMVADISGSMNGSPLSSAQYIMSSFLDNVQFGIGDQVELTLFSNGVYTAQEFTGDKGAIVNQINNLYTQDMTSLYDALYVAVNRTAIQNGAKCVIAFTDGMDNYSQCSPDQVIEVAQRYNIPIFIIGVGDSVETSVLENIAQSTNGYYTHISNIADMGQIYQAVYRAQKELYVVQYVISNASSDLAPQDIRISIQGQGIGGTCETQYSPRMLLSATQTWGSNYAEEDVMGRYLNGFVKAINSHDYSYIADTIVPNSPIYEEVYPYIQKDIKEKLLSYEVLNKEYVDENTCILDMHETYEILNNVEPLHMRTLESSYVLKKQANGDWKLYAFNGEIKVLSKIRS